MAKQSNLPKETTMYSINPLSGEVTTHHLPWERTSPQLENYTKKGFTFERPVGLTKPVNGSELYGMKVLVEVEPMVETVMQPQTFICPECGRGCKSEFGLAVHRRVHSKD